MMRLPPVAKGALLAMVAVVAALSVWFGSQAAWADAQTLESRWLVSQWRAGQAPAVTPELWNQARENLQSAVAITPNNPHLFDDLGFLYASRAQAFGTQPVGTAAWTYQQALLEQAQDSYRSAAVLRPNFPYSWLYLALAKHLQGQHDAEFWQSFDKAYAYGNTEAAAQPTLALMAFANWADLGSDRQARVATMVATAQSHVADSLRTQALRAGIALPTSAAL